LLKLCALHLKTKNLRLSDLSLCDLHLNQMMHKQMSVVYLSQNLPYKHQSTKLEMMRLSLVNQLHGLVLL
jgi:hypothetical protein